MLFGCLNNRVYTLFRTDPADIANVPAARYMQLASLKAHNISNHVYSLGWISVRYEHRLHEFRRSYKPLDSPSKTSAQSRHPVANGVTGALRPLAGAVTYRAPPFATSDATMTNFTMRHQKPRRAQQPIVVQSHHNRNAATLGLVEYRGRNRREKIINVHQVGKIGIQHLAEIPARSIVIYPCEKRRSFSAPVSADFRTAPEKRDNSMAPTLEAIAQSLDRNLFAAQPTIGVMDKADFHCSWLPASLGRRTNMT